MQPKPDINTRYIVYAVLLLSLLSACALAFNFFYSHYPGNNYSPGGIRPIILSLILVYVGLCLQFGHKSEPIKILREVFFFYIIIAVMAIATTAVQYTPFSTIDTKILAFETYLHINTKMLIEWTQTKPGLKLVLEKVYNTLPYQIGYIPLILIVTRRWNYVREFYFLMLVSTIIGFSIYYFFPTIAPASIIASRYFSNEQYATAIKFTQIHYHIQPTTFDGGMISFPSFHVIWAWFCLYALRAWSLALIFMLPVFLLLFASCVLLGWHYLVDLVGSILIIGITHALASFTTRTTVPTETNPNKYSISSGNILMQPPLMRSPTPPELLVP